MVNKLYSPVPVATAFGSIGIGVLLHYFVPFPTVFPFPYNFIGVGFIGLGVILLAQFFSLFRKYKTTIHPGEVPTTLITDSVYRFSRNPAYLAHLLIVVGVASLLSSLASLISPIIYFLIVDNVVIPFEERNLKERFGETYERYQKSVRRWV